MKLDRIFSKVHVARGIAISVTWFLKSFYPFKANLNGGHSLSDSQIAHGLQAMNRVDKGASTDTHRS
jgi:hypothetical protein